MATVNDLSPPPSYHEAGGPTTPSFSKSKYCSAQLSNNDDEVTEENCDQRIDSNNKPKRPKSFEVAYFAVGFTIVGILIIVTGVIIWLLRNIQWKFVYNKPGPYHYFGRNLPKNLGPITFGVGCVFAIIGAIIYNVSSQSIDKYIQQLIDYNSKKPDPKTHEKGRAAESIPLMPN